MWSFVNLYRLGMLGVDKKEKVFGAPDFDQGDEE